MIKLYSDFKFAPNDIEWIRFNDAFFNSKITASKLTDKDLSMMYEIEGLTLLSKEDNLFKSKTGIIPITNISTSLKTLLNIRWLKRQSNLTVKYGVDITECGSNVLDYVFDEITDGSIPVVLRHWDVLGLKNRYIEINGTVRVKSMNKLYNLLG
ncbi:MAG: hypothetical protein IJ419_14675 [Agathobacter sp.]|nr:hypothetical protein [Agathobacter sp.]